MANLTPEQRRTKINNIVNMIKDIVECDVEYKNGQDVTPARSDDISVSSSMIEIQQIFQTR